MGLGQWLLLGDLGPLERAGKEDELRRLQGALGRLHRISGNKATKEALREIEKEVDELKLYLAAIIRLLVRKGIAGAEEIRLLVEAIDLEDGTADGKREGDVLGTT